MSRTRPKMGLELAVEYISQTRTNLSRTQEQWNLATVFKFHYWSHSSENKMKFLAEAFVFHKHREEQEPQEEEVTSYSSEEDSDA